MPKIDAHWLVGSWNSDRQVMTIMNQRRFLWSYGRTYGWLAGSLAGWWLTLLVAPPATRLDHCSSFPTFQLGNSPVLWQREYRSGTLMDYQCWGWTHGYARRYIYLIIYIYTLNIMWYYASMNCFLYKYKLSKNTYNYIGIDMGTKRTNG